MRIKEFKKLLNERHVDDIISMYTHNKIYLTSKQLDEVLAKKNGKEYKPRRTQADRVLDYIKQFGSITTLEAFRDLGVTRLSARIFELRARSIDIESTVLTGKNRFGENVWYSKYFLKKN